MRNEVASAFLNRAQFERGAVLLVPNSHVESILDLESELVAALYQEAQRIARAMVRTLDVAGINIFQNNGVRAGQSISHYHIHIVPRYQNSRPWERFRESAFAHTPVGELEIVARELRSEL